MGCYYRVVTTVTGCYRFVTRHKKQFVTKKVVTLGTKKLANN